MSTERVKTSRLVVGDTLHIVMGDAAFHDTALARIASRALASGKTVKFPDGRSVWHSKQPIMRKGDGSAAYTWHRDGNRVRCELVEQTLHADGRREQRTLRQVWGEP